MHYILFYPITLEDRWGTTDEFPTMPFHLVLFLAGKVYFCPLFDTVFPPLHLSASFSLSFRCALYIGLFLLSQKTLKHGGTILVSVSWRGSGVHHILQWLPGSFCQPTHWSHGPGMKLSTVSGSISSQKPANRILAIFLPPMLTFPSCSSIWHQTYPFEKNVEEDG